MADSCLADYDSIVFGAPWTVLEPKILYRKRNNLNHQKAPNPALQLYFRSHYVTGSDRHMGINDNLI
jgi:hypothetical protein